LTQSSFILFYHNSSTGVVIFFAWDNYQLYQDSRPKRVFDALNRITRSEM